VAVVAVLVVPVVGVVAVARELTGGLSGPREQDAGACRRSTASQQVHCRGSRAIEGVLGGAVVRAVRAGAGGRVAGPWHKNLLLDDDGGVARGARGAAHNAVQSAVQCRAADVLPSTRAAKRTRTQESAPA
jgi:hypothetical protein